EVGALVDNSADMRDVTATIVDLAVRGWLQIEKQGSGSWSFHTTKPQLQWETLCAHERRLLDGLFTDGRNEVDLDQLRDKFYVRLRAIRDRVFDRLLERGYYRAQPMQVRKFWLGTGICGGGLVGGAALLGDILGQPPMTFFVAGGLTAAVVCGFALI